MKPGDIKYVVTIGTRKITKVRVLAVKGDAVQLESRRFLRKSKRFSRPSRYVFGTYEEAKEYSLTLIDRSAIVEAQD